MNPGRPVTSGVGHGPARGPTGLSRAEIARKVAHDLEDGFVVNLGVGIPLLVPQSIETGVEVIFHAENGVLGMGPLADEAVADPDLTDAGKQPITLVSGAAIVDSATSFAMIRGGHLDVTILGALQVSARGDLANWYLPGHNPAVGGAMDLVAGVPEVWVAMEHVDRKGRPKLVEECTMPLTGQRCVTRVYTDLATFHVREHRLHLVALTPGVTADDVRSVTNAPYVEDLDRPSV